MPPLAILLAHGAGAPSSHPWMRAWAERLGSLGRVATFDYPYAAAGKRRPDRHDVLVAAHRAALAALRREHDAPVLLVGKSMGSRIGCHVALLEHVDALVCLGYPLVSADGRRVRDEVLVALETPVLFVQGSRDALCPLERLASVRARMRAPSELVVLEGADHSLLLSATARRSQPVPESAQAASDRQLLDAIAAFVARSISARAGRRNA